MRGGDREWGGPHRAEDALDDVVSLQHHSAIRAQLVHVVHAHHGRPLHFEGHRVALHLLRACSCARLLARGALRAEGAAGAHVACDAQLDSLQPPAALLEQEVSIHMLDAVTEQVCHRVAVRYAKGEL